MKKLMILFASILSLGAARVYADTTTPRLGLVEPTIGSTGWGVKINANMAIVDSGTAVLGQANIFTAANTFQAITATTATVTHINVTSSGTVQGAFSIGGILSMNGFEVQGGTTTSSSAATTLATKGYVDASTASIGSNLNASNLTSGTIPNARQDSSSVTLQSNTFNAASKLVQLNGSTQLPAVSGVNLTNLNASNLASGTVPQAVMPNTVTSSWTVTGAGGVAVTYGVNVGTFTGAGLSTCGDSSHALAWSSVTNTFSCQSITGSASAGGSQNQVQYNNLGALAGTAAMTVNTSSVTVGDSTHSVFLSSNTTITGTLTLSTVTATSSTVTSQSVTNLTIGGVSFPYTNWASYTPSITGCGTVASAQFFWKQIGDTIFVQGQYQVGTPSASEVTYSLPNSTTINSSKINGSIGNPSLGTASRLATGGTVTFVAGDRAAIFSSGTDRTVAYVGNQSGGTNLIKTNGSSLYSASDAVTISFSYPI